MKGFFCEVHNNKVQLTISTEREREREFHIALPDLRPWGGGSKLNTLCLLAQLLLFIPFFGLIPVVP